MEMPICPPIDLGLGINNIIDIVKASYNVSTEERGGEKIHKISHYVFFE